MCTRHGRGLRAAGAPRLRGSLVFIIDVIAWDLLEIMILSHLLNHLLEGGRLFCHPHRTTNSLNVYNKKGVVDTKPHRSDASIPYEMIAVSDLFHVHILILFCCSYVERMTELQDLHAGLSFLSCEFTLCLCVLLCVSTHVMQS